MLHILIIDDSEDDALLIIRALRKGGLKTEFLQVEGEESLRKALTMHDWDVVISDHNMPGLTSQDTIKIIKAITPDMPVIVVSGTIEEQVGVEAMKTGAQDYVMKDNLARLVPVIQRELKATAGQQARKEAEQNLHYLSFHDTLTNLLNRKEFERRLRAAVDDSKRFGQPNVLMYLDLDQFKIVNDTCGHVAGDELLKQVTRSLQLHIRESDTLARLGGDEFGILLENTSKERALTLAERIRQDIKDLRFSWQDKPFAISISIGMVAINQDTTSIHELLSCADMACYAAKDKGRDGIQWYSEDDAEYNQRRNEMQWASKIKKALEEDRFILYFQPMKALQPSCKGEHGEFLVRLYEEGGLVPPGAFIPAAERYNLMPLIDRWVVKNVFQYLSESGLGKKDEGTFFINLSGTSLSDNAFFDDIRKLLKDYDLKPNRICLEITETAAINNLTEAVEFITEIRDEGFKFALDDFGVGMSSFSYLKTIPVDYLKVDGSFVQNLLNDPIDKGIVEACNRISHAAGLQTIAEFVENQETEDALKAMGVDFGQGFGIAKPGPLKRGR
ncbi:EAL domain-containing protein [Alkalimarinus alittae]|uniref:EAL domain-containing protein n=1 Tax=Alkalimarinus alittae TaxID=2961619 RepID=A0ABY6N577_9ALTE|nr:EAL domain-containing protein [Alkalimarinus alittae]UZE97129.1 EAL domain-containing protein [Alkalimarinus alittae]